MGVKANLTAITFTTGGKNQAEIAACDLPGIMLEVELAIAECITKLTYLVNDVLTPSGTESSNITTVNTAISALS